MGRLLAFKAASQLGDSEWVLKDKFWPSLSITRITGNQGYEKKKLTHYEDVLQGLTKMPVAKAQSWLS